MSNGTPPIGGQPPLNPQQQLAGLRMNFAKNLSARFAKQLGLDNIQAGKIQEWIQTNLGDTNLSEMQEFVKWAQTHPNATPKEYETFFNGSSYARRTGKKITWAPPPQGQPGATPAQVQSGTAPAGDTAAVLPKEISDAIGKLPKQMQDYFRDQIQGWSDVKKGKFVTWIKEHPNATPDEIVNAFNAINAK